MVQVFKWVFKWLKLFYKLIYEDLTLTSFLRVLGLKKFADTRDFNKVIVNVQRVIKKNNPGKFKLDTLNESKYIELIATIKISKDLDYLNKTSLEYKGDNTFYGNKLKTNVYSSSDTDDISTIIDLYKKIIEIIKSSIIS